MDDTWLRPRGVASHKYVNASADLPQGTVTFVFTDIEGSTRLLTALGGEYPAVLSKHHAAIRRHIAAHHGSEVKTEGDAFFVAFARPADAVGFCVDVQRELVNTDWSPASELRVRMAAHTGLKENEVVRVT